MTRETMIALVVALGGVLAIGGGVALWSGGQPSSEQSVATVSGVSEAPALPINEMAGTDEGFQEDEDVTRIIIQNADDGGGEIQNILSGKIIINDEVKDTKELKPANPKH